MNIINNIINIDINIFKNNIDELIFYSKQKIQKLELLNDICDKIKEEIIFNYELMIKRQENNIIEYNILMEYEKKLDYIISLQNKIMNDLITINNELNNSLNSKSVSNKENEINEEEFNQNVDETNNNIKKLENYIQEQYIYIKNFDLNNLNDNKNLLLNENDNFFDVLKSIYEPIKKINKDYTQIRLECTSFQNK